jgi:hypothetical protein
MKVHDKAHQQQLFFDRHRMMVRNGASATRVDMMKVIASRTIVGLHLRFCDADIAIYMFCSEARDAVRRNSRAQANGSIGNVSPRNI